MEYPTLISRTSLIPIIGVLGDIFSFFLQIVTEPSILKANSEDSDQTTHYAVSDLGLPFLSLSNKKDARLIRIIWYLSHKTVTIAQTSLLIRAVLQQPSLLAQKGT